MRIYEASSWSGALAFVLAFATACSGDGPSSTPSSSPSDEPVELTAETVPYADLVADPCGLEFARAVKLVSCSGRVVSVGTREETTRRIRGVTIYAATVDASGSMFLVGQRSLSDGSARPEILRQVDDETRSLRTPAGVGQGYDVDSYMGATVAVTLEGQVLQVSEAHATVGAELDFPIVDVAVGARGSFILAEDGSLARLDEDFSLLATTKIEGTSRGADVAVNGDNVYVASRSGLQIFEGDGLTSVPSRVSGHVSDVELCNDLIWFAQPKLVGSSDARPGVGAVSQTGVLVSMSAMTSPVLYLACAESDVWALSESGVLARVELPMSS